MPKANSRAAQVSGLSTPRLVEYACEIAGELKAERNRHYSLVSAITSQLTPPAGEDAADPAALALSEILEELLSHCGQTYRLIEYVEALREAHPG